MTKNPEELLQKIKQLESELKKVKSCKRYWLVWEDKPEIFEEKAKNALPILQEDKSLRIEENENKPNNIIIEWDNYHSLSALSYTHKGKIDVIYIDPPYNTWNKDFIYNDSFVDKEDSYRHSKWLSFMSKRLKLAKELLSDDWIIFLSIDDNEFAQLKLLWDEIFLADNFVWCLPRISKKWKSNDKISKEHDFLLVYSFSKYFNKIIEREDKQYNILDKKWRKCHHKATLVYEWKLNSRIYINWEELKDNEILIENKIWSPKSSNWKWKKERIYKTLKNNEDIFKTTKEQIYYKTYKDYKFDDNYNLILKNNNNKELWTLHLIDNIFSNSEWEKNLSELKLIFTNPKPKELIKILIKSSSNKNSTILDFFAGSWTTGHATMELNKEDWWNRQFILCSSKENSKSEPEKNICKNITYERNKRVIEWYTNSKWEKIEWLGWNLRYYTNEFIKADKSIDDLRYSFINMCDDLLCIKENTFTEVKLKKAVPELRLFKKWEKYTAILYDIHHFKDLVKLLEVLDWQISVYIFSLSKDIFEEELEHLNKNITVQNIPDDILQTYKKIFNF